MSSDSLFGKLTCAFALAVATGSGGAGLPGAFAVCIFIWTFGL